MARSTKKQQENAAGNGRKPKPTTSREAAICAAANAFIPATKRVAPFAKTQLADLEHVLKTKPFKGKPLLATNAGSANRSAFRCTERQMRDFAASKTDVSALPAETRKLLAELLTKFDTRQRAANRVPKMWPRKLAQAIVALHAERTPRKRTPKATPAPTQPQEEVTPTA